MTAFDSFLMILMGAACIALYYGQAFAPPLSWIVGIGGGFLIGLPIAQKFLN